MSAPAESLEQQHEGPGPDQSLKAAKPPVGTGPSPLVGQLLALALIALGVVAVQEALVRTGAISQRSWTSAAVTAGDGAKPQPWMVLVLVAMIALGLLLLLVVLKPRPRKALVLDASTGVFLRTRDLGRIAEQLLDGTDGVTDVDATATQRRLRIETRTVAPASDNKALEIALKERLQPTLDALRSPPKVSISIRNEELS